MAMLLAKCATTEIQRTELYKLMHDARFMKLCSESVSGFAAGRLPGDLGDNPEAVDAGEGEVG